MHVGKKIRTLHDQRNSLRVSPSIIETFHAMKVHFVLPVSNWKPKMDTLANNEDPGEMPQSMAINLGLYCFPT